MHRSVLQDTRLMGGLLVFLAIAWFPNPLARATGRPGPGPAINRASPPRILLIVAWVALLALAAAVLFAGSLD